MARLSKPETKRHDEAQALLDSNKTLRPDEVWSVLQHWSPMANHNVGVNGIFFTPVGIPQTFGQWISVPGRNGKRPRILDLCAGIGSLTYGVDRYYAMDRGCDIVAVEIAQPFVDVGKRLMPQVQWVCGNVFDWQLIQSLGQFDFVVSNPPFGNIKARNGTEWLDYKGAADLMVAEIALRVSVNGGLFILPSMHTPYEHGSPWRSHDEGSNGRDWLPPEYVKWQTKLGGLATMLGTSHDLSYGQADPDNDDTSDYQWKGAKPNVELVEVQMDDDKYDGPLPYPGLIEAQRRNEINKSVLVAGQQSMW